jgi:hypothetical protein
MKVVRWLPLLVATLVIACAPPSGTPSRSGSSPGVSATGEPTPAGGPPRVVGTVTAGPVCPVEQSPPDPRCAPRPVAGAIIVATNAAGEEVGRTTSAADGSYELTLGQTGTVLITGLRVEGLMGLPQPVQVTVPSPSSIERVDLEYDTGIR